MSRQARDVKPLIFAFFILLATSGFASSFYLARSHYSILSGKHTGASFCTVSQVVDCDAVATSPYSEMYQIPLASFGALVYLLMFSFSLLGLFYDPLSRFSLRFLFFISALCVLFDAYLAFVGFVILKLVCLVCIFTYLVNLAFLVLSKRALKESLDTILKKLWESLPFLDASLGVQKPLARLFHCLNLVIVLLGLALILGARWHFVGDKQENVKKILEGLDKQKPVALSLDGAPRLGPHKPKVTLVEFSDFQCPYCKEFASALKMVQKRYSKEVTLYFKHYPLDDACNPYIQRPFHQEACKLAQMSICLQDLGRFWDMDEVLFSSRGSGESLKRALSSRGIDPENIISCSLQSQTRDRVLQDIHEGRNAGVRATPTIFINGYRLEGAWDPFTLSLLVERLLLKAHDPAKGGS
ncbi:MAG: vitamin K epoxide reductase family protein [bacterium]